MFQADERVVIEEKDFVFITAEERSENNSCHFLIGFIERLSLLFLLSLSSI